MVNYPFFMVKSPFPWAFYTLSPRCERRPPRPPPCCGWPSARPCNAIFMEGHPSSWMVLNIHKYTIYIYIYIYILYIYILYIYILYIYMYICIYGWYLKIWYCIFTRIVLLAVFLLYGFMENPEKIWMIWVLSQERTLPNEHFLGDQIASFHGDQIWICKPYIFGETKTCRTAPKS